MSRRYSLLPRKYDKYIIIHLKNKRRISPWKYANNYAFSRLQIRKYRNKLPLPKRTKKDLSILYGNICQYCFETFPIEDLTVDHVLPISKKGTNNECNLVLACRKCNYEKGNSGPLYFLLRRSIDVKNPHYEEIMTDLAREIP